MQKQREREKVIVAVLSQEVESYQRKASENAWKRQKWQLELNQKWDTKRKTERKIKTEGERGIKEWEDSKKWEKDGVKWVCESNVQLSTPHSPFRAGISTHKAGMHTKSLISSHTHTHTKTISQTLLNIYLLYPIFSLAHHTSHMHANSHIQVPPHTRAVQTHFQTCQTQSKHKSQVLKERLNLVTRRKRGWKEQEMRDRKEKKKGCWVMPCCAGWLGLL